MTRRALDQQDLFAHHASAAVAIAKTLGSTTGTSKWPTMDFRYYDRWRRCRRLLCAAIAAALQSRRWAVLEPRWQADQQQPGTDAALAGVRNLASFAASSPRSGLMTAGSSPRYRRTTCSRANSYGTEIAYLQLSLQMAVRVTFAPALVVVETHRRPIHDASGDETQVA